MPIENSSKNGHLSDPSKIAQVGPKSAQGGHLAPFWGPFWLPFWVIFVTFSGTGRKSRMSTACRREHQKLGSSISKNINCWVPFRLRFRPRFGTPSGTSFWSHLCRSGAKKVDFGVPSGPRWAPKWLQKGPREAPRAKIELCTLLPFGGPGAAWWPLRPP